MDLLNQIISCSEEEVDSIISNAIKDCNNNAQKVERLGFLNHFESINLFKGFIPLNTRIKYNSFSVEDYGMESTDFYYEFAHYIREHGINNKAALIHRLESFINFYFGYVGISKREDIFNEIAWKTTTTDEEYFNALENNKIGDLKGKGAALCTERSALAQELLSLFGIESYYCMGSVNLIEGGHCFNIIKRKNDYALLDYSIPVAALKEDGNIKAYYPFIGILSQEEFLDFVNNGTIKSFDDYYISNKQHINNNNQRMYVVGKYDMQKEDDKNL